MVRDRNWFWSGTFVAFALCATGLLGCAAGGGGGTPADGPTPAGEALDVNFTGAAGGNYAVAQDEDGNEYTFRQNEAGDIVEANIQMADTGQTVKASMDSQGRPVKYRATDGTNADVIYDGDEARVRYTASDEEAGSALDVSGIDSTAAKQRVLMRRAAYNDKRAVAMQQDEDEDIQMLREGLREFEERTESLFEDPDSPLPGTPLEDPCLRIARIGSIVNIREVAEQELADVDLDEVPDLVAELAGRSFELFDAQGFCIAQPGAGEAQGFIKRRSRITFDSNGILLTELDRKFLFDLGLGGAQPEITINWEANTTIDLTQLVDPALLEGVDLTADVTPVFTGTQLDDDDMIIVERRFLAEFEFPVEAFTTTTARTEQLFNAAFINGELFDNILEFDLVLIDLAGETEPRELARLRYYDANTRRPEELLFPCDLSYGGEEGLGSGLKCPPSANVWEPFYVEFDAGRGGDGHLDDGRPPDDGAEHRCSEEGERCASDDDCCPGKACMEGVCVFVDGGGSDGERQVGGRECEGHWDCAPDEACENGFCMSLDEYECFGEFDCPEGLICNDEGRCVECLEHSDCSPGDACAEGTCVGIDDYECVHELDCPEGLICNDEGFCVPEGRPPIDDEPVDDQPIDDGPIISPAADGRQYDWYVSSGFGYVVDPFAPGTEVVPTDEGLLEVTLIVSYAGEEVFDLYTCEVFVGDIEPGEGAFSDCPDVVQLGEPAFYSAAVELGPGDFIEWFVPGTSDAWASDPQAVSTEIVLNEPGRFDVSYVVYRADGHQEFGICLVNVQVGDFDWCDELGWYGDEWCDWDCPRPDPDCQGSDWCEQEGWYDDGFCDLECPHPDPDCEGLDWCAELGWYDDAWCDWDCPRPDPDCLDVDWCELEGWYGDGWCDWECPRPDPDCVEDWCELYGWYGDGSCDWDCPRPDPDCQQSDWCEEEGWYGDGWCDWECPRPDPDCVEDWCELQGWYGDGSCDSECPRPDPDCQGSDWCQDEGWYGDGWCDWECPRPDPDCEEIEFDWCEEEGYYGDDICDPDCPNPDPDCLEIDWCEEGGWYGDGWCDWECPRPDPDCEGVGSDWCEQEGYYGDGICDPECPHPDPDCELYDWCAEEGLYGDGWCNPDCPEPDPDCGEEFDQCAEYGWYGDGECDDCPRPDPDCETGDWCAEEGLYGDGWCHWDCPELDPDCFVD